MRQRGDGQNIIILSEKRSPGIFARRSVLLWNCVSDLSDADRSVFARQGTVLRLAFYPSILSITDFEIPVSLLSCRIETPFFESR